MARIVIAMLILAVAGMSWLEPLAEMGPSGDVVLARFTTNTMTLGGPRCEAIGDLRCS